MNLSYTETVDRFTEGLAQICGIYGVNPLYGRLYGTLFLTAGPVPLEDLTARVGAAKSTVSVAIRKLVDARVVRRTWRKSDRRDWYEAATDPQQLMRDLVDRYVRPELDLWGEVSRDAESALAAANGGDWPLPEARDVLSQRIRDIDGFREAWERALAGVEADLVPVAPPTRIAVEFEP